MFLEEEKGSLKKDDRANEFEEIRNEVLVCTKCPLSRSRTKAVPGEGDMNTEIVFIGEAPGANEDTKGIPFCGAAGKFLDEMLKAIGLDREKIFITNTVKCRPPENRDPEDSEKIACRPYLERQLKVINPKLIVCLGRHATASIIPAAGSISQARGKVFKKPSGQYFLPLYHPAAALHNGGLRQTLMDDFKKIPSILEKIKQEKNAASAESGVGAPASKGMRGDHNNKQIEETQEKLF